MQKRVNFFHLLLVPMVALALWSRPSHALEITPSFDPNFSLGEWVFIEAAIFSWTRYFAKGGPNINIKFVIDDNLFQKKGRIADTEATLDAAGRPISAVITIDRNDLSWPSIRLPFLNIPFPGPPNPNGYDALWLISHEVGHALGFNINSPIFQQYVKLDAPTGDLYLDLNGNGQKDQSDFDLEGNTHAGPRPPLKKDVLDVTVDIGERILPTREDAELFNRIYHYQLLPIPQNLPPL